MYQKTTLANGIRVVTETMPGVNSVAVGVWVDAGSRDERRGEEGMTHFIEHMVFKGTRRRRVHQIASVVESVGGELNAVTGKENTCYYARVLGQHLDRAIDVLLDLVLNPTFPESELEKEKEVVLEEMRMYEDDPEEAIFDHFERVLYGEQPMGAPIIGYTETVEAFRATDLADYMQRHYTMDRMIVGICGQVSHEKAVRLVEKWTKDAPATSGRVPERTAISTAPQRTVCYKPIQQAHLLMGTRCIGRQDPRRFALSLLNTVLSGGMSSRLNLHIRERYGFCYNIYSSLNTFSDMGDFSVYMGTDAGKIERAKALIWRELKALVDRPLSPRALYQAKQQLKAGLLYEMEGVSTRLSWLGFSELYHGRQVTPAEIEAEIEAVTAEDVQHMARELFVPENFAEVIFLPEKRP